MMKKSKGRKSKKRSMRASSPAGRRKLSSRGGSSRRKVSGRRTSTIKEPSEIFTL